MKNTKKLLAVMLSVFMMMSLFTVNTSALLNNWSEYKWDFQAEEIGTGAGNSGVFASTVLNGVGDSGLMNAGGPTNFAQVVADPAGVEGNKVLKYSFTSNYYSSGFLNMWHAHMNGAKVAFSFRYYFPETGNLPLRAEWLPTNWNIELLLFSDAGMYICGNQLKDANGDALNIVKGAWNTCTIVVDDTPGNGQNVLVDAYINGYKALSGAKVLGSDYATEVTSPMASGGYDKCLRWYTKSGTGIAYLDDFEARSVTGDTLKAVPTVTIDSDHQGEEVAVSSRVIDLSFISGTDNVMDASTYKGNISVKAGAMALVEGADYDVTYSNLKDVKITLKNDMAYNTNYSVTLGDGVKTLANVAVPTAFSFKTERKVGDDNSEPIVTILGINNKTRFDEGEGINFSVNAMDNDGDAIKSVKIFADGSEIASDNEYPYEFSINSLTEGTHSLVAVATDEKDAEGTSAEITVIVKNNTATEVNFSIQNKYIFFFNENVEFSAYASDADGEALSDVLISVDGGNAQANVFSGALSVGTHNVLAKVTDSRGNEYSKEITIEYRPEIKRGQGHNMDVNFDARGFTATQSEAGEATLNRGDAFTTGTAVVDAAHGNSFYFESSASSASAPYAFVEKWSYWRDGVMSFDFYAEDVTAQDIGYPYACGGVLEHTPTIRIINGEIKDTKTGIVYGTIENNRWYRAELFINSDSGKVIYNLAGHQFIYDLPFDGTKTYVRAFAAALYIPKADAPEGKKFYVDNIRDDIYGGIYAKIDNIEAVSASGKTLSGGVILSDTTHFIVNLESPMPSGQNPADHISFYHNGQQAAATVEFYGAEGTNNGYKYYSAVKVTPAEGFISGDQYTIKLESGTPSYPKYDTVWSTSTVWSLCEYDHDFVVCDSDFFFENAGLYDGDNKVSKIVEVTGSGVSFNVDVTNISGEAKKVYAVAAAYAGDTLLDIKVKIATVEDNTIGETIKTAVVSKEGASIIKGFIWGEVPFASNIFAD